VKLLVFGQTGQVATELQRCRPNGVEITALGRDRGDLSDPQACANLVVQSGPDAVINAAAYTAVDKAESEEPLAKVINGDAPGAIARACAAIDVPLVHISTDYVFAGTGSMPWSPSDPIAPINAYGRTKAAGEAAVRASGAAHGILRTSWVFSAHGANFVKTMLRLGADRTRLTIVSDQIGGPTPAATIAEACLHMAAQLRDNPAKSGTYHFSGAPDVSWADFARAIFDKAGLTPEVADIPTTDYPTPAARPLNSRLDCSTTKATFGIARPDWRAHLDAVLKELR